MMNPMVVPAMFGDFCWQWRTSQSYTMGNVPITNKIPQNVSVLSVRRRRTTAKSGSCTAHYQHFTECRWLLKVLPKPAMPIFWGRTLCNMCMCTQNLVSHNVAAEQGGQIDHRTPVRGDVTQPRINARKPSEASQTPFFHPQTPFLATPSCEMH
jgi:hypothetical protein